MNVKIITLVIFIFMFFLKDSYGMELSKNSKFVDEMAQKMEAKSERLKRKYGNEIISEEEAINIAKGYRQNKEYTYSYDEKNFTSIEYLKSDNYEYTYKIDWDNPRVRLEFRSLKKDGSLSSGLSQSIL
jgi:hypothetical protein